MCSLHWLRKVCRSTVLKALAKSIFTKTADLAFLFLSHHCRATRWPTSVPNGCATPICNGNRSLLARSRYPKHKHLAVRRRQ
eukprot:8306065-Karenia_brevis.AAC.1